MHKATGTMMALATAAAGCPLSFTLRPACKAGIRQGGAARLPGPAARFFA